MNTQTDVSSGLAVVAWLAPSNYEWPSHFISLTEIRNGEALVRLSDAKAIINDLQNLIVAENQRKQQLEQEVERLTQKPTIEDAETTVEHLLAYAADNGYSHGDYADVMTEAANKIEQQAERIAKLESERGESQFCAGCNEAAKTIEKQSAALKLAGDALASADWNSLDLPEFTREKVTAALAAIDAIGEVK